MKCLLALSVTVSQQEKMASFMIPNEDDEVCKKWQTISREMNQMKVQLPSE